MLVYYETKMLMFENTEYFTTWLCQIIYLNPVLSIVLFVFRQVNTNVNESRIHTNMMQESVNILNTW